MLQQSMAQGSGEKPDEILSQQFSVPNSQLLLSPESIYSQVHPEDSKNMFLSMLGLTVPVSRWMKILQNFSEA